MSHLVTVAPGHTLRDDAAEAYLRMLTDGCPTGITSSTRSYATQLDWYRHQGQPGYPAMADNPDRSKHVWRPNDARDTGARALDLPEPARSWVRKHGAAYGWMCDRVRGEAWHMEYEPEHDEHTEDDMPTPEQIWGHKIGPKGETAGELLVSAAQASTRAAARLGGSTAQGKATITEMLRGVGVDTSAVVSGVVSRLKAAGVANAETVAREVVDEIAARMAGDKA